jgi:hypothetical protein
MTLRADHVAGAVFIAFGLLIIALSGDLPVGQLSMPGSGFLPKILAGFTIAFGIVLIVRARESGVFANVTWATVAKAGKYAVGAAAITAMTALTVYLLVTYGIITAAAAVHFLATRGLLAATMAIVFVLLAVSDRHAAAVTAITAVAVYWFEELGFLTTMVAMMFVLLVAIERRRPIYAALYSVGVVGLTYLTFVYVLKTPLITGPYGF